MPKKSAEKEPPSIKEKAVKAALSLAAEKGWNNVILDDVAEAIEMQADELHYFFAEKTDILIALGKMIDDKVLEAMGSSDPSLPARDVLFDIMMERFDVLNEYRDGLTAILKSFKCDPKQAVISAPHLARSMSKMLDAAGIETEGLHGCAKVAGLTALYLKTLRVWVEDETEDMAKTMAELDKNLGYAERAIMGLGI